MYISRISPGSPLAKEGNIAVGDRVLSVNNKSVEHKSAKVCCKKSKSNSTPTYKCIQISITGYYLLSLGIALVYCNRLFYTYSRCTAPYYGNCGI